MLGLPRVAVLVAALVRIIRRAMVLRVALARAATFRLDETGPLELNLEGPGLGRMPPIDFTLRDHSRDRMFLAILGIVVGAWFFTFGLLSLVLGV